ncbi:hypothetical protein LCGC14_1825930 [marine sediment metagenome]|uniref:Uncharacterized protein n=1 Tax=marine sediment metagenome TaxID=412755 RepID=A0A0F9JH40_9ZZZZ
MPLRGRSTARPPATRELALKTARRLNLPPISQWPAAKWPVAPRTCDHCHDRNHPAEYTHGDERWCVECSLAKEEQP